MVNIFLKNKNGFSVLEVVVALLIITIGMLGVSSLVIQNIQVERVNKNYLIASMLAQEGLELVRNIRDSNWLPNPAVNWYNNIYDPSGLTFPYFTIDSINDVPLYNADNLADPDAQLFINGGWYEHTAVEATPFYRLITSTVSGADSNVDEGEYLNITCTVQWTERGQTHKYVASTLLYNWR